MGISTMMSKRLVKSLADDLQAKYFQGIATNDLETEVETYAQIELISWILEGNHARNKTGFGKTYRRTRKISNRSIRDNAKDRTSRSSSKSCQRHN